MADIVVLSVNTAGVQPVPWTALRTFIGDSDQVLDNSSPSKIRSFSVNGLQAEWGYDTLSLLGWPREIELD